MVSLIMASSVHHARTIEVNRKIMTGIICIGLVCVVLIILYAFSTWAFSPIQPRIADTMVICNRPTALSETVSSAGSKEIIMSPSRARRRAQCRCGRRLRLRPCLRTHRG